MADDFRLTRVEARVGGVRFYGVANGVEVTRDISRRDAILRARAAINTALAKSHVETIDAGEWDSLLHQAQQILEAADNSRVLEGLQRYQSKDFAALMEMATKKRRIR